MHSTIFEISEAPIDLDERLDSTDFLIDFGDVFLHDIADSVGDLDEEDEKSRVSNLFGKLGKETGVSFQGWVEGGCAGFTLHEDFPEKYFKSGYERFSRRFEKIRTNLSLETFSKGGFWGDLWALSDIYENKHETYVVFKGELCPLNSFLRNCAEPGKKYYIGGVLDYHA